MSREPFKLWWAPTISPEWLKLEHVGYVKSQRNDDKSPLNGHD